MYELREGTIDLWCVAIDNTLDSHLLARCRRLLNAEELSRENRFHFADDRHRYLVTRALVRDVLSRYAPIRPEHWRFVVGSHGRPEVSPDIGLAPRISFNISHTVGLIVLVVGADISLGVDTENIRVRPAPLDVANRFFSQEEIAALRMLPATEQHERFFQYWTLKESYIKARGHGLSIPLDKFSMRLSADGGVNFSVASCLDDDPQRWKFWQLRPTADTCAAICAERVEGLGPDLTVRNVIPLESEDDASVTKTSTCASFCEEGVSLRV